jgi:hypothetical protein
MFDMWRPKNAMDGRYAWVPITFPEDGKIEVHWKDVVEAR